MRQKVFLSCFLHPDFCISNYHENRDHWSITITAPACAHPNMMITATAEIDTRGRLYVPAPARKALDVNEGGAQLEVIAHTIEPTEYRFARAHFTQGIGGERGRMTVPKAAREQLGVEGVDGILELTMTRVEPVG